MANSIRTTSNLIMARDSRGRRKAEYARHAPGRAMAPSLFSRRKIAVWGGLLVLVLLLLFCRLAYWQWEKAEAKFALQAELDARSLGPLQEMPTQPAEAEALRYHRFVLRGEYNAAHQILIDNRVHAER